MNGTNTPGNGSNALVRAWRAQAVTCRDAAPLGPALLPGSRSRWATVQSEWEAFALLPHGRRRELLEFVASELIRNAARVTSAVVFAVTQHDDWLVIDVIDHAGATTGARLDAALSRARRERRARDVDVEQVARDVEVEQVARDVDVEQVDCGAGVGLFLIERRAALLTLRVSPGRFTCATAVLWLGLPANCPVDIGAEAAHVVET